MRSECCFMPAAGVLRLFSVGPSATTKMGMRGVILDLDGTLTRPHAIDFDRMRSRLGMPLDGGSILHWIEREVEGAAARAHALRVVEEEERAGLSRMALNDGFGALATALSGTGVRTAIATRNGVDALAAFDDVLERAGYTGGSARLFPVQLARGHVSAALGRPIHNKPSHEPAHEVLRAWGVCEALHVVNEREQPRMPDFCFVGDNLDDCLAGRRAGLSSVFVTNGEESTAGTHAHKILRSHNKEYVCHVARDLHDVADIVRHGALAAEDQRGREYSKY